MPHSFIIHGLFGTTTYDVRERICEKMGRCHVDARKERQGGSARWVLASNYGCNWWPYDLLKAFDLPYILTKGLN